MSIDPRAIADETGVDEEDVVAVLDALDETDVDENEDEDNDGESLNGVNPDDPFWETAGMFPGGGPTDVARNHDKYLYGEERPE